MEKKNKIEGSSSSSVRWTVQMDKVFIEALTNEEVCGNQVDGQFTSRAYGNMLKACSEKLKFPFTKNHLKNRLKTLKSNFGEVKYLFNASGWGWNEETTLFENDDEVWKELIEKKPKAAKWKYTPFHHYGPLYNLFSKDRATGELAGTAKEKRMKLGSMRHDSSTTKEESNTDLLSDWADSLIKGKKRKVDETFQGELLLIKEGLDNVAQALREGNAIVEKSRPQVFSNEEIYRELTRMELDAKFRRKAYRFLNEKQARVRDLFGCPMEERKTYLMDMLLDDV